MGIKPVKRFDIDDEVTLARLPDENPFSAVTEGDLGSRGKIVDYDERTALYALQLQFGPCFWVADKHLDHAPRGRVH